MNNMLLYREANNNNNNVIKEEIVVPDRVAQYIKKNIDENAFKQFKQPGCALQPPPDNCPRDHRGLWLILTGSQEENNARIDLILDYLKTAELKLLNEEDEDRQALINFMVIVRMLIPKQKMGYVRGKQSATLKKIEVDCEVSAQVDRMLIIPVPDGYDRLILRSSKVEGLRQARIEILRIQQQALPFNPNGLADGRPVDANEEVEERIEMPLFSTYNDEQKNRIREIQKWAYEHGIDQNQDKNTAPTNACSYLLLRGPSTMVVECKSKFADFLMSLERNGTSHQNNGIGGGGVVARRVQRRSDDYHESNGNAANKKSLEMLIPFPTFQEVIGWGGETIRALQQELGVRLIFLGKNEDGVGRMEYPDGRWLRILGPSEEKCRDAKAHIEREYVDKRRQQHAQQQHRREQFGWVERNREDDIVQMEMRLPEDICPSVLKIKKKYGLTFHDVKRPRATDRCQLNTVLLRGTKHAVEAASAELEQKAAAYAEFNGTGNNNNNKSGDEGKEATEEEGVGGELKFKVIQKKKCVNINVGGGGNESNSQNSSFSSTTKSASKKSQNDLQLKKKSSEGTTNSSSSDMVEEAISAQMVDDDDDFGVVKKRGGQKGKKQKEVEHVDAKEVDSAFERKKQKEEEEEYNDDDLLGGDDISSFKATTNTQWGSDLEEEDQVEEEHAVDNEEKDEADADDDDESTQDGNDGTSPFNNHNFDKQMLDSLSFIQTFGMQVEELLMKYKAVCKENKALVKENGRLLLKLKLKKAAEGAE